MESPCSQSKEHIWRVQGIRPALHIRSKGRGLRQRWHSQPENVTAMVALTKAVPNLRALWTRLATSLPTVLSGGIISRSAFLFRVGKPSVEDLERVGGKLWKAVEKLQPRDWTSTSEQRRRRRQSEGTGRRSQQVSGITIHTDSMSTADSVAPAPERAHQALREIISPGSSGMRHSVAVTHAIFSRNTLLNVRK